MTRRGELIYQTDTEFESDIRHYGCYLLSLCFQLDRLLGLGIMDHKIIETLYNLEGRDGDIGAECFIQNPQGICDRIANGKVKYIGRFMKDYVCMPNEFEILHFYNPNTEFGHFVAGFKGTVIYDPIQGGSRTVREGYLESKRIYTLV